VYEYRVRIVRVVDGDTLHADVDLGFDSHQLMTLRLLGIDAPEIRTEAGRAAKQFLQGLVDRASLAGVIVETVKDRREKYGRYLATLRANQDRSFADPPSFNQQLIDAGHARPYDGGTR
jgi:micrococcal nuclease